MMLGVPLLLLIRPFWIPGVHDWSSGAFFAIAIWLLASVAAGVLLLRRDMMDKMTLGFLSWISLISLLLIMLGISTSLDNHGFWGVSFDSGTLAAIITVIAAVFTGYVLVKTGKSILQFLERVVIAMGGLALVLTVAGLFRFESVISILKPDFSSFLLMAVAFVLSVVLLVLGVRSMLPGWFYLVLAGVFGFALLFSASNTLLLVTSIVGVVGIASAFFSQERAERKVGKFGGALLIIFLLFAAGLLNLPASPLLTESRVVPQEIRPSHGVTTHIVMQTFQDERMSMLTGSGFNTFGWKWNLYAPQQVNSSAVWDTDLKEGSSLILTLLVSVGIPAVLLVSLTALFVSLSLLPTRQLNALRRDEMLLAAAILLAGALVCFFVPNLTFLATVGLLGGAYAGVLSLKGHKEGAVGAMARGAMRVLALVLIVGSLFMLYSSVQRLLAVQLYALAAEELQQENVSVGFASKLLVRSNEHAPTALALRTLSFVRTTHARQLLQQSGNNRESEEFIEAAMAMGDAEKEAQRAVELSKNDFRNWLALGRVTMLGGILNEKEELLGVAFEHYSGAVAQSPGRPQAYLAQAELAHVRGRTGEALDYLGTALELKPDYQEALQLLERIRLGGVQTLVPAQ